LLKEEKIKHPNGSERTEELIFWVQSTREGSKIEAVKVDGSVQVIGKVGNPDIEATIQNREQATINLLAIVIVIIVTAVLVKGIQESAGFNAVMVAIKIAAVLFVIGVGAFFIQTKNWTENFAPFGWTGVGFFGIPILGQHNASGEPVGVLAGAAIIFFA